MTKIKQIQLHNFQSYENETIDVHDGINIFIGTSNHGKSAVIRALLWVITNRPMGTGFVSYWSIAQEKMDTSVKVFLDSGAVIERKRTEDFNGYVINNIEKLEAVGHDVPFKVQELFGLVDYNIQQQFDSPFLLSSSSGEVARFFNQVIKIDDIDRMLKTVEQKKRKTRTDLSYSEKAVEQYKNDLKKLEWVDRVKDIIPVAEELDRRIVGDKKRQSDVTVLLHEYQRRKDLYKDIDFVFIRDTILIIERLLWQIKNDKKRLMDIAVLHNNYRLKIDRYKDIDFAFIRNTIQSTDILIMNKRDKEEKRKTIAGLANKYYASKYFINTNKNSSQEIKECEEVIEQVNTNTRKKRMLSRLVDELAILYKEKEKYRKVEKLPELFDKMERVQSRVDRQLARQVMLKVLVDDHKKRTEVLIELKEDLKETAKKMPDVCPLCGNKLKEGTENDKTT